MRPAFRSSSTTTRCSRASEPWWARATRAGAVLVALVRELVEPQREPLGEATVVHEDDRRAVLLDEAQQLGVDRRPDRARPELRPRVHLLPVGGHGIRQRRRGAELAKILHRHDDLEVELLARAGVDERDRATAADEASDLLERSLRRRQAQALQRPLQKRVETLDERARWAPRLVPATAWTSSRISVSTPRRISRACEVRSRKSDSGVVIRTSGGLRSTSRRSFCGVSPVRTATRSFDSRPASGPRRLRSMS